jgi:hypothetical protein
MKPTAALLALAVLVTLTGCDEDKRADRDNFSHLTYYGEPTVQVSRDPGADFAKYHTVALVPTGDRISPVAMKQIAQTMRLNLELHGFAVVDSLDKADLLLCVYADSEQKESYIPPQTIPFPVFSSGRRTATTEHWSGTIGGAPFGATGRSETRERPRTQYVPMTVPGRTELRWWPYLSVLALDASAVRPILSSGKSDTKALLTTAVWDGTAFGATDVADPALAVQGLFRRLAQRFPAALPLPGEDLGMVLFVASVDGQTSYPAVLGLAKGGPADRAGVRTYDLITAVDAQPTSQLSGTELRTLLEPNRGIARQLTIKRLDAILTVTVRP